MGCLIYVSPLASHVSGCLIHVSPLASHVSGCLIHVSPLASHDSGWRVQGAEGPPFTLSHSCKKGVREARVER
jgi:hypothetical protein